MKNLKKVISLLLVIALTVGFAVPVSAVSTNQKLHFSQSAFTPDLRSADATVPEDASSQEPHDDDEIVRVSIVLEEKPTIDAGFSTMNIAQNSDAMAYRSNLQARQDHLAERIQSTVLDGEPLDVVWNLTLAANIISANVEYGQIEEIKAVNGVQDVVVEAIFEPAVVDHDLPLNPNMSTSTGMIGSTAAYAAGYTGAGSRVAIIDTGTDTDHQSFSAAGYDHSLGLLAEKAGMGLEDYKASLHLLDTEEIAGVLQELNAAKLSPGITAEDLFVNDKLAYGFNYIDGNLTIHHDSDNQGSHGSHVAGIAAANAYIPTDDGFAHALDTVLVQGVAPDAQIITMKVFGQKGAASESDYMAAIEDAIVLGADAVNLSLGSVHPGFSANPIYEQTLARLTESDTVLVASAGNAYSWPTFSQNGGYLYGDDINMHTGGFPGCFTNSLGIASVENDGYTGNYLQVADSMIFYTESAPGEFSNLPITTLSGTQEFIMIDGIGSDEEFAAIADVLSGKIAVCYRGEISFYEKAENAVKYGAIATIICNNQPGTFGMDLSGYTQDAPCIALTQADGEILRDAATMVADSEGNPLYYRGEMKISNRIASTVYHNDYYTMSDFSSWGVPGSLELKPEITAPGGNIYSVNGVDPSGSAYENMSGTSMAAPQVTGMMALLAQHLRGCEGLAHSGMTRRALSQSLLMSTAVPMVEEASGSYWPVLKQGSGLANIGSAVSAQSYLVMGEDATSSYDDGKIKVELGDDPDRTGAYQYSFTVSNFSGTENSYTLSTDLFTQDMFVQEGQQYMDTRTMGIPAVTTYVVGGETFVPNVQANADVDKDGDTDADDAQALLEYLLGNVEDEKVDLTVADLDGNGQYTTYDAHLILANMETRAFTVPAGGSVEVQVNIVLPASTKSYLDTYYPSGAYVEGYTFLHPVASREGRLDVTHSIPILGFYGNWSEASMFDKLSYADFLYGESPVPYVGVVETNNLIYRDSADQQLSYQIGNPYTIENSFPTEKAAIRSTDTLAQYRYTLIRNAAAMAALVTDEQGNVLYSTPVTGENVSAYYYVNGQEWQNTADSVSINKTPDSLGVSEGERIRVSLVAIPEYYIADRSDSGKLTEEVRRLLDSGELGSGCALTTSLVIDDTAPELLEVSKSLTTGDLTVTARDNQHIAYVAALSRSGVAVYGSAVPTQDEAGQTAICTLDVSESNIGEMCMIFVADYAGNSTTYTVEYGGQEPDFGGKMLAFTASDLLGSANAWVQIDPETVWFDHTTGAYGGMQIVGGSPVAVAAADYADGYIFFVGTDNALYTAPVTEPDYVTKVTDMGKFGLTGVNDMAMNHADGKLYLLDAYNGIWTVNPLTGAAKQEFTVEVGDTSSFLANLLTLAIDDAGNFYAVNYGSPGTSGLYTWTLEDVADGTVTVNSVGGDHLLNSWMKIPGSLAWDHDNDILYLANAYTNENGGDYDNKLWIMDTVAGTNALANQSGEEHASQLQVCMTGLMVIPKAAPSDTYAPTDEVLGVDISLESLTMMQGAQVTLDAVALPWNLNNRELAWASSDEGVATVAHGTVTAVAPGEVTITAASMADPTKRDTCTITVNPTATMELTAAIYDADSAVSWADFSTDALEQWQKVSDSMPNFIAGGLHNGKVYVHDGSSIYCVNPDTLAVTNLGSIASDWLWSDAASAPRLSNGALGYLLGLANDGTYLELIEPEAGNLHYLDMTGTFQSPMAAVAFAGDGDYYGLPANNYYLLLENGDLYTLTLYALSAQEVYADYSLVGNTGLDLTGVSAVIAGQYASMIYDAATGYLALSTTGNGDSADLYIIDPATAVSARAGDFGENVWPVVSLYQYDRPTDLTVRMSAPSRLLEGTSATVKAEVVLYENDPSVTWASSDTSIATVEENGLVTGIREGMVTITATTVEVNDEGQHVSASVTIHVEGKGKVNGSASFHAQIQTPSGNQWVTVNTADLSVQVNGKSDVFLTGGGAHDGKIYGSDSDYINQGHFYRIDPADGYSVSQGSPCSADYAILDVTTAPALDVDVVGSDGTAYKGPAFGQPLFLANAHCMFLITDYMEGTVLGDSYLSSTFPNSAAIAYGGLSEMDGVVAETFYVLSTDGTLDSLAMCPDPYTDWNGEAAMNYSYGYLYLGNVGRTFDSHQTLSMTVADTNNDGITDGLIVADSGMGRADLFFIDLTAETYSCVYIGSLDGATNISSLYSDGEMASTQSLMDNFTPSKVFRATESMDMASADRTLSPYGEAFPTASVSLREGSGAKKTATGSLNTAIPTAHREHPQTATLSAGAFDKETRQLTVPITASESSTNGRMQVSFDSSILTLLNVSGGMAEATASRSGKSTVELAYASANQIAAENAVAVLTFRVSDKVHDKVALTVSQSELDDAQSESSKTLEIALTHVCPHDFVDVEQDDWFHEAVDQVYADGLMVGMDGTHFQPEGKMTRAQLVTVIYRLAGSPEVTGENPFPDVKDGSWYADAVTWAAENHIVKGITEDCFAPHESVTREQMTVILHRYAQFAGLDVSAGADLSAYTDAGKVHGYAKDAVAWAVASGLIRGVTKTTLAPRDGATRAQVATILVRFQNLIGD